MTTTNENVELMRVIAKIRGLMAKTTERGASEAEAIAAAQKAGELMAHYNLTIDRVFIEKTSCVTKTIQTDSKHAPPIVFVMMALANYCDCKTWMTKGYNGYRFSYFGMETDVDMAVYLHEMISNAIEADAARFKATDEYHNAYYSKKRSSQSFKRGMADRIASRLNEMKHDIGQTVLQEHYKTIDREVSSNNIPVSNNNCTDMVHLKLTKVQDEYSKFSKNFKTVKMSTRMDYTAHRHGMAAGEKVGLNRPIGCDKTGNIE